MKKLLIVAEFDSLNGGENSLLAVLPLLIESGWRIKIAFPGGGCSRPKTPAGQKAAAYSTLADRIAALDLRSIALLTHFSDGTRKTQAQYRDDLGNILKTQLPDLVLCNSLSISRLVGPVTQAMNVPAVGYIRDILKLSKTAIADINQLDRIVAVSTATQDFHVGQGIDAGKIQVIRNGVDLDRFCPPLAGHRTAMSCTAGGLKSELAIPSDRPALLFVGQLGLRKGVDLVLDVFERLQSDLPDCHLLIVGQRHSAKQETVDYEGRLIDRSQSAPLAGKVHWLGRRDDLPEIYRGVDLLLHPARQEPLGRVLLEAIASGLPVITTSVGGSPEIVGSCQSMNLLYAAEDVSGMTAGALALLRDSNLRSDVAVEVRRIAVDHFGRQRCFVELDNLLCTILTKASGDN